MTEPMTEQMTEQMMEWSELKMVLAVGRAGSLSAAARVLGVDKSTVLRQITGLEKKLGVRLFERMPQGYLVTAAMQWVAIADEVDWLVPLIWKKKEQARLRLVLTCTSTLGAVQAIRQGMGVGLLPCFLGAAQQDLQRLGEPLPELASELWVLTHPDLRQTARVRALMTFIQQGLGQLAF